MPTLWENSNAMALYFNATIHRPLVRKLERLKITMRMARKWIPDFIKPLARFLYYPQERAKAFREPGIREKQNQQIKQFDSNTKKIILFLISGADYDSGKDKISGGIISIVSFCEESKKLKSFHGAEVVMSTFPGEHLLTKHSSFRNDTDVFRFSQLQDYFREVNEAVVHVPEFLCLHFIKLWETGALKWLKHIAKVHVNVLNQNVRLMPGATDIKRLKEIVHRVTVTTAHQQYCNKHFRDLLGVPIHKLSVWISPEKYQFKSYQEKENLIVVSPDVHPEKEKVMKELSKVPGLKIEVIQNLTYEQYKEKISFARWTLTFGEGLDGYFIEPIFSGAIGFAVYNNEFFTSDFFALPTVYDSMEILKEKIIGDIDRLNNAADFRKYQQEQFAICAKHYSEETYKHNIELFYKRQYTYA